jgi:hypothetical protein
LNKIPEIHEMEHVDYIDDNKDELTDDGEDDDDDDEFVDDRIIF